MTDKEKEFWNVLKEETDGFASQSRLRDDVLDAMKVAYLMGKRDQLISPDVSQQTELLKDFLKWRLGEPYSDFQTQDYDISRFLKAYRESH